MIMISRTVTIIIVKIQNDFKVQLCDYKEEKDDILSFMETFSGKLIRDLLRKDFNPFSWPDHPFSTSTGPPRLKSNGISVAAK